MSSSYQKIILVGNLGGDPVMNYTPSGQAVTNFSLAINQVKTDQTGQAQEETMWLRVSVWGKQAETCNQYLTKGRQVLVEGKLKFDLSTGGPRTWVDQKGVTRSSFELSATDVRFLGNGNGNGKVTTQVEAGEVSLAEDEIPF